MKRILFSTLFFLLAVVSGATITFSLSDVQLQRAESVKLPVILTNDEVFAGFELKIFLPEGVSFQGTASKECVLGAERLDGFTIAGSRQSDGSYKILVANLEGLPIEIGRGVLFYLLLKVDDNAAFGEESLRLGSIRYSQNEVLYSLNDVVSKMTISPSTSSISKTKVSVRNSDAWLLNGTRATSTTSSQVLRKGLYIVKGQTVLVK